jgi:hypothetical protein
MQSEATNGSGQPIDVRFTGPIVRDESVGGWTIVPMPGSSDVFGTRKPVKVSGTIDGHPFAATMLPLGDGTHMVPIKAALRKTGGKEHGADVTLHLDRRYS